MKSREVITKTTIYMSEVRPEVETTDSRLALAIKWADENPRVWKIVMGTRSKAFGRKSCEYIGWAQNKTAPEAVLERAHHFYSRFFDAETPPLNIYLWRAAFTFDHYEDPGFCGGFFQQWDENYPRSCLTLDYTPETLEEVIDRFEKWMGTSHKTVRITVDAQTVRTYVGLWKCPISSIGAISTRAI